MFGFRTPLKSAPTAKNTNNDETTTVLVAVSDDAVAGPSGLATAVAAKSDDAETVELTDCGDGMTSEMTLPQSAVPMTLTQPSPTKATPPPATAQSNQNGNRVSGPSAGAKSGSTQSGVRKSIDEWEAAEATGKSVSPAVVNDAKKGLPSRTDNRVADAKTCVVRAKLKLNESRNLRTDIKDLFVRALDRLFLIVKEAEAAGKLETKRTETPKCAEDKKNDNNYKGKREEKKNDKDSVENTLLLRKMIDHSKLIEENSRKMEELKEILKTQQETMGRATYASVAAGRAGIEVPARATLHSVMVASTDETETGEVVLSRIRKAVNARENGIQIERVRKAKNQKVIVGCRTEEEKSRLKERLTQAGEPLRVEDVENKDPLLILKDVLSYNTDEEIVRSLTSQNRGVFDGLDKRGHRLEVKYRKRTRNPHTSHVVLKVSPEVWTRMLRAEAVHIDLQRVRVFDQSPLVQCSLCLGYGHTKRFCKEPQEKCSHCGGPHLKAGCDMLLTGASPECCNCKLAKLEHTQHNAFSQECPVRRKWDALARASIAYC